jgi:CRISPR-associated protein Cmr1
VEAALWAWETFGGLGGRTRRGFGAVTREDGPGAGTVAAELAKYQDNPRIAGVPSLRGARFVLVPRSYDDALAAWKNGLGVLQTLRQGAGFGRNLPSRPMIPAGRSRWPEPDEIRKITRQSAPLHSKPVVQVSRFPRAVFGLPIVFHFVDSGDPNAKPLQLQPVGDRDRFASPLILRPLTDGTTFRSAALVLASDVPDCELLVNKSARLVAWSLDLADASGIPALRRNGNVFTDPLQLFLEELEK